MLANYEKEQTEITEKLNANQLELDSFKDEEKNASAFIDVVKRYADIESLNAEILNQLIQKIDVGVKYKEDKVTKQDIIIYYNFVGNIA